ncbi:MAG TPA: BON domain-containing protein [Chloroflexota bacterium]|jgi:hypothetical protein
MAPDTWPWEQRHAPRRLRGMLPGLHIPDVRLRERSRIEPWQLLAAAAFGGALVYFLDPVIGNRRRKLALQRAAGALRRWTRSLGRTGRKMGDDISGKRQALIHGHDSREPMDDATLAHKVESVLFRDPQVPKGRININAEHGVVVLRGEVEQPSEMRDIERTVRDIAGVHEVRSLLHLASSQG